MKALYLTAVKQPFELRELPDPVTGPGQVRIKVEHAALNHRDLWIQLGQYAGGKQDLVLGSDLCGTIDTVGEGVTNWQPGQRVIVNCGMDWGPDLNGQQPSFHILGNPSQGSFAELVVVPASQVHAQPAHLDSAQAAAIPLAGLTAWRALMTRGKAQPGQRVLITGIGGGVAQFALQFAAALGCQVWVTSSSEQKIAAAKEAGAQGGYNYRQEGWAKAAAKEGLFDVIIDGACGPGFSDLIDLARTGGTIVIYGGTAGPLGPVIPAKVFWRQLNICGSTMGNPGEFNDMLEFVNRHQLVPAIDQVYDLEDAEAAFARMAAGGQTGKIVLRVG